MIVDYLKANNNFGMRIEISREETLLDTGGGLKKAAWFFLEDSSRAEEPFILHNVDVISTIDLGRMMQFHIEQKALATLAVQNRETSRYLLFDEQLRLCGRRARLDASPEMSAAFPQLQALSLLRHPRHFSSPVRNDDGRQGAFSIIASYLNLAAQGEKIVSF